MEDLIEDTEDPVELEDDVEAVYVENDVDENPGHPEVTGQPTPE